MEKSVTNCEVVLFICTPYYKQKADSRIGGVGYKNTIISAELYETQNEQKFIPVLFSGSWKDTTPIWAKGKLGIDLSDPFTFEENYKGLVENIKK